MKYSIPFIQCILFFVSIVSHGKQFLYPVASYKDTDGATQLLLIYQTSPHHLELWRLNPSTQRACKALLSHYIPAGLSPLPNNKGFSFIDQGRLRIQYFHKRSPSALDFPYPMYDFHRPQWLDEYHCFFSAKRLDHFCIFYGDMQQKTTTCLIDDFPNDSMYPQIIDDTLFFIKRTTDGQHSIATIPFQPTQNEDQGKSHEITELLYCYNRALAFLYMISSTEGYFLEHPIQVSRHDPLLKLTCHHFFQNGLTWQEEQLFSFSIPMHFLKESKYRLYESILPFLPCYMEQAIIFVHCNVMYDESLDEEGQTELYSFALPSKVIHKLTNRSKLSGDAFSPLIINNKIFYGGSLRKPGKKNPDAVYAWIDEEGTMHTQLPGLLLDRVHEVTPKKFPA